MSMRVALSTILGLFSVFQIPLVLGSPLDKVLKHHVFIKHEEMRVCGGIAVSSNEIITSASCLSSSSANSIQVTSFGSATHPFSHDHAVIDKCIPDNFDVKANDHTNDIAILRLREPIVNDDSNTTFGTIEIAEPDLKFNDQTIMQVVGYVFDPKGTSDSSIKMSSINLSRIPIRRENDVIGVGAGDLSIVLGACNGTGGVSAFIGNKLVGLTTNWKPDCDTKPGSPIIFTSISHTRFFIDECLAKFRSKDYSFAHKVKELLWSFTLWG
ncbi:hypothetical protein QAD02_019408 [Eretmocerus hayati]|uniref:Uncharacterized protein n=1 Tax=Eretmocerus hayati TaxID=131215 RepID=A0ACC2PJJ0_9HYME|nr:hypothetical protein QAD02_019408 [Eretmocerus hayati]